MEYDMGYNLFLVAFDFWVIGFITLLVAGQLYRTLPHVNVKSPRLTKRIFRQRAWWAVLLSLGSIVCTITYMQLVPDDDVLFITRFPSYLILIQSFFAILFLIFGVVILSLSLINVGVARKLQNQV